MTLKFMPATSLRTGSYSIALQEECVTLRFYADEKLLCSEWRGVVPSDILRQNMLFICQFILDHEVEFILADYSLLSTPSVDDQLWVANHAVDLLKNSSVRRSASVLAPDFFQQLSISPIHGKAGVKQIPWEVVDFSNTEEALDWLNSF